MKLAVVVPAFHEERLLKRTLKNMPECVDVIVVVDDGSQDETFFVARRAAERDPRIEIIRLGYNQGVGRAISMGYQRALSLGAGRIAVMAGDDQMNPEDLPVLLEVLEKESAGYVKGNRLSHPSRSNMPTVRRFGTMLLARATRWISKIETLNDSQCGYTVVTAAALDRIDLDDVFPRYGYPNQMLIDLAKAGVAIAEAPVEAVYADEVSGFSPANVVLPIGGIFVRALIRA